MKNAIESASEKVVDEVFGEGYVSAAAGTVLDAVTMILVAAEKPAGPKQVSVITDALIEICRAVQEDTQS